MPSSGIGGSERGVSVINAYLWPRHASQDLNFLDLHPSDIQDAQNVLRLQRDIERAFDRRELNFTDSASSPGTLVVKVLCPTSLSKSLEGTTMFLQHIVGRSLLLPGGQHPFKAFGAPLCGIPPSCSRAGLG